MATLSYEVERGINVLFSAEYRQRARWILRAWQDDLDPTLVGAVGDAARSLLAALKVSHGDTMRLRKAIQLGKTDFRDLLTATGFADTVTAHKYWGAETGTRVLVAAFSRVVLGSR